MFRIMQEIWLSWCLYFE